MPLIDVQTTDTDANWGKSDANYANQRREKKVDDK